MGYKNRWALRIVKSGMHARLENKVLKLLQRISFCLQSTTDLQDLDASLCYISLRSMNFWLITFIKEARSRFGLF